MKSHTRSCGCYRTERIREVWFKDLTGKRFGRLVVVKPVGRQGSNTMWLCDCDCGNETVVRGPDLSNIVSCGCYNKEIMKNLFIGDKNPMKRPEVKEKISGKNSYLWKDGISFGKYCPKFNDDLRNRIRAFFGYSCVICNKSEYDNKRKLSCHHVNYDKFACCDDKIPKFATLCNSCHGKTQHNRENWELMLNKIIDEIYNGKSYYTKNEYATLFGGNECQKK